APRRGVRLERGAWRALRAARLHRELQHPARRRVRRPLRPRADRARARRDDAPGGPVSETRDPGDAPALAPPEAPVRGVDRGDRPHAFDGTGITVTWSRRRCIHVAACVMNLPDVFKPGDRPWIDMESAPT